TTSAEALIGFQQQPLVVAIAPDEDVHVGRFGIALEPIAVGEFVRAEFHCVHTVQVDIGDAEHDRADVTDGDNSKLTSTESGAAQILYKPSGTGTQWCIVRLGAPAVGAPRWFKPALSADLESADSSA